MAWSPYIAYFDESGDHGLGNIDQDFPVFVLCGCLFKIDDYLSKDGPAFSKIKFDHFGHDAVVFHSHEIRKQVGPFQILQDARTRERFMDEISEYYKKSTCTIIASGILKVSHKKQYKYPDDPYGHL